MKTPLFVYRCIVGDVTNDNFINPLAVNSFYWSQLKNGDRVLVIFLTNNWSVTFNERVGQRFVEHMHNFLSFLLTVEGPAPQASHQKRTRQAIQTEVIDEVPTDTAANWVSE